MANEFKKTPNEKIWYPVGNFERCLQIDEIISTQNITVYDENNDPVTATIIEANSSRIQDKKVIARIINGVSGNIYQCRTLIATNLGNEYEAVGYIKIID